MLSISKLHAEVSGKTILNGISLTVRPGEIHAIMGPNGSGKSTLAYTIAGHPKYKILSGQIKIGKTDLTELSPDKRALAGVLLSFQHPQEIPGLGISQFLQTAVNAMRTAKGKEKLSHIEFRKLLRQALEEFSLPTNFMSRSLNEGFSGGEKKKLEITQISMLEPKIAIFDEIDSGLDVDALKTTAKGIKNLVKNNCGLIIITHYQRILKYIKPDFVHVMVNGKIMESGDSRLAARLERKGYTHLALKQLTHA